MHIANCLMESLIVLRLWISKVGKKGEVSVPCLSDTAYTTSQYVAQVWICFQAVRGGATVNISA